MQTVKKLNNSNYGQTLKPEIAKKLHCNCDITKNLNFDKKTHIVTKPKTQKMTTQIATKPKNSNSKKNSKT